ncbi:reverse transcriptase domain-containing protein [Calidithermus chliarophilus]|uniref:reverse transcriptase domain-containing protein n=1 Tax=Calidithermus chliarophilus TaxID=52023 RepID=UPI000A04F667|nr:reverse transcriptase domain-containing protein [Calidithermus chliarophilus]
MSKQLYLDIFSRENILRRAIKFTKRKHAVGIDGKRVFKYTEAQLAHIVDTIFLSSTNYKFSPYRERLAIKDRDRPPRLVSIPTIRDQVFLSLLKDYLHEIVKPIDDRHPPNKIISDVYKAYQKLAPTGLVTRLDIQNYYPSVAHEYLYSKLSKVIPLSFVNEIIHRAITNPTVPLGYSRSQKSRYMNSERGIPQGLAISNVLAHIYLVDLDVKLRMGKLGYWRYVDDFVIFTEKDGSSVIDEAGIYLAELDLSLNMEKVTSKKAEDGFNFLGYRFQYHPVHASPIVRVADHGVRRFLVRCISDIRRFKKKFLSMKTREEREAIVIAFIDTLNEKITGAYSRNKRYGWLFYFSQTKDKSQLHLIDKVIAEEIDCVSRSLGIKLNGIKSAVKAYHLLSVNPRHEYFLDYDKIISPRDRYGFLVRRNRLKSNEPPPPEAQVHEIFESTRDFNLSQLESDVGIFS